MNIRQLALAAFLMLILASCNNKDFTVTAVKIAVADFEGDSAVAWAGGVADYPADLPKDSIRFSAAIDTLPSGLDTTKYALHVYSRNATGSLFTFVKAQMAGLARNTAYEVVFEIDLGTNYPEGSPAGNKVYLKAGGSDTEPTVNSSRIFSLDKGTGASGGKDMVLLGNVSSDSPRTVYLIAPKTNNGEPVVVKSDNNGRMWLCVGIESLNKGRTDLYFDKIKVTARQR